MCKVHLLVNLTLSIKSLIFYFFMKKKFLLFGLSLAAMSASAQTAKIQDVTLAPGEKGFVTIELDSDVHFEGMSFGVSFGLPNSVTLGEWKDMEWGGIFSEPVPTDAQDVMNNDGICMIGVSNYELDEVDGPFTIKIPIVVAEDAEEGSFSLMGSQAYFKIGGVRFNEEEGNIEYGTLTIGEAVAPLTYAAKIYEAAGVTVNMNVADAASLQSYLSSHKNAIAVFASAVPDEIAALDNVVVDGVAKSIVLTSQNEYPYTGEAFVAEKVSFEYWIGTKATKAGGWNSLAIPFTGTPEVEPFTTADMNSGKYWAKVYTGSNSEGLLFGNLASAQFEANKSYLVAFPGSDYGVNEFTSVTLNITAENEKVYPAANNKSGGAPYSMTTVYAGYTPASSYVLNAAGTKFEYKDAMQIAAPFTAFASAELGAPVLRSLAILDANQGITSAADAAVASTTVYGEDGEIVIIASEAGVASIVNMNGQVVKANVAYNEGETRVAIAAGAYVVAGQVVIVK